MTSVYRLLALPFMAVAILLSYCPGPACASDIGQTAEFDSEGTRTLPEGMVSISWHPAWPIGWLRLQ